MKLKVEKDEDKDGGRSIASHSKENNAEEVAV